MSGVSVLQHFEVYQKSRVIQRSETNLQDVLHLGRLRTSCS